MRGAAVHPEPGPLRAPLHPHPAVSPLSSPAASRPWLEGRALLFEEVNQVDGKSQKRGEEVSENPSSAKI